MTEMTPLDLAHATMEEDSDDDAARLRFYERLAESELFLMLEQDEPGAEDQVTPELFDLGNARYVLVFDREERLASFSGEATPYVALSGRSVASMLAGQDIGLGVNLDVAPSSILLPHEAVAWLNEMLGNAPETAEARVLEAYPPKGLPEQVIKAIDAKLATAMGLAHAAYLVAVTYEGGRKGHMLCFVDAVPQARDALAKAASEALVFSNIEAGTMDVSFLQSADKIVEQFERVGLRFDLPQMQQPVTQSTDAPGMDPDKPPKLK